MEKSIINGIFTNAWAAELTHAEMELHQIERERALEDVMRLIKRFELTVGDITDGMGPEWSRSMLEPIKPFEPYFS